MLKPALTLHRLLYQAGGDKVINNPATSTSHGVMRTRDTDAFDMQWSGLLRLSRQGGDGVATQLMEQLAAVSGPPSEDHAVCSRLAVSEAGFLQVRLSSRFLFSSLRHIVGSPAAALFRHDEAGRRRRVIVDFASPNYAKELHVGHFRSIVQGECLSRVLEALGHDVVRLSHVGDFGTPIGLVIAELADRHGEQASIERFDGQPLSRVYVAAKQRSAGDAAFLQRALHYCSLLQLRLAGQPDDHLPADDRRRLAWAYGVWQQICAASRRSFDEVARRLDVSVQERGESFYAPLIGPIVDDLLARSLVRASDGALLAFFDDSEATRQARPPLMVRKRDGSYLYASTDLACIKQRVEVERADWLVYVTDRSQRPHFEAVFELARRAGYLPATGVRVDHVGFGLVRTGDGHNKKVSSRDGSGDDATLDGLLAAAEEAARARSSAELTAQQTATLGLAALRYFDLSHQNSKDYVFAPERMLAWKGNTSSYVMYAYTRARSILRHDHDSNVAVVERLCHDGDHAAVLAALGSPAERELAVQLASVGDALLKVESQLSPHLLCDQLYDVANAFHVFYGGCPVLDCQDRRQRAARLLLVHATAQLLKHGLYLLGINQPTERM